MPIPSREQIKVAVLQLLSERGPLSTSVVYKELAKQWQLTEPERTAKRAGGRLYEHEIRWARQELVVANLIERPGQGQRGTWQMARGGAEPVSTKRRSTDEGALFQTVLNKYERSGRARTECIAFHGARCKACDTCLYERYGPIAFGRTHVHHLTPLSKVGVRYTVDPITDLVPLCPNCHYVAHLQDPPLTVEEIKALLYTKQLS